MYHNFFTFNFFLVYTDIENKAAWKECFQVEGVKLPTGYYFGVTATTGDLSDSHDIISIRMYELDLPNDVSEHTWFVFLPEVLIFLHNWFVYNNHMFPLAV